MTTDELKKLDEDLAQEEIDIIHQLKDLGIATENPAVKGDFDVRIEDLGSSLEDAAQELSELDRNQALVNQLEKRLKDIRHTREKIKEGSYGTCEKCSASIPVARLQAMPVAALCIDCAKSQAA